MRQPTRSRPNARAWRARDGAPSSSPPRTPTAAGAAARSSPRGSRRRTRCTCSTCSASTRRARQAQRALAPVHEAARWDYDPSLRFWDGEVEPCINGRTVAIGAYFGQDVRGIVDRLLTEQMADGGWNCEQENGSTRGSFDSTLNVLEGLLEYERSTGGERRRRGGATARRGVPARASPAAPAVGRRDRAEALAVRRLPERVVLRRRARPRLLPQRAARSRRPDGRGARHRRVEARRRRPLAARPRATTTRCSSTSARREGQPSRWITLRALRIASLGRARGAAGAPGRHRRDGRHPRRPRQRGDLGGPPGRLRRARLGGRSASASATSSRRGVVLEVPGRGAALRLREQTDPRRPGRGRHRRARRLPRRRAGRLVRRASRAPRTPACCACIGPVGGARPRTRRTTASGR